MHRSQSACALLSLLVTSLPAGSAGFEVDVALVIAVDVSSSMEPDEQQLQRQGFTDAFRSREIQKAIRRGAIGRIGVTYTEWAGPYDQRVLVPWTLIETAEDALQFADRLARSPIRRAGQTSISGAIDFGMQLLAESGLKADRRVIDISGDGPNNLGRKVTEARDEAVASGVTINGLPLMLNRTSTQKGVELDLYFRDCVIGGAGAFLIPVRDRQQFAEAIRLKVVREIAGGRGLPIQPASADRRSDCQP